MNLSPKIEMVGQEQVSSKHSSFLKSLFNENSITEFLALYNIDKNVRTFINYWDTIQENNDGACYIIFLPKTGFFSRKIYVGFMTININELYAELNFAISTRYQNKGLATNSLSFNLRQIHSLGIKAVVALIYDSNKSAQRVAEKVGMILDESKTYVNRNIAPSTGDSIKLSHVWGYELIQ